MVSFMIRRAAPLQVLMLYNHPEPMTVVATSFSLPTSARALRFSFKASRLKSVLLPLLLFLFVYHHIRIDRHTSAQAPSTSQPSVNVLTLVRGKSYPLTLFALIISSDENNTKTNTLPVWCTCADEVSSCSCQDRG